MKEENQEIPSNTEMERAGEEPAGPQPPSKDDPVQLRQELESKKEELKVLQDKYLRIHAEFENFRKRAARDQEEFNKYANERLLKELLPVVDNLERAIYHARESKESPKILEGLELVLKQYLEVLGKFGVQGFDSYLQPFDPAVHQAVGKMETEDLEDGMVVQEIQRGYRFNDRVLRPSSVMVSKKKMTGNVKSGEDTADPDQD